MYNNLMTSQEGLLSSRPQRRFANAGVANALWGDLGNNVVTYSGGLQSQFSMQMILLDAIGGFLLILNTSNLCKAWTICSTQVL